MASNGSASAAAPLATPQKLKVQTRCTVTTEARVSPTTGRKGRQLEISLYVALDGWETITAAAPLVRKGEVGDKSAQRLLLQVECEAFIVDGLKMVWALQEKQELQHCEGSILDIGAIERDGTLTPAVGPNTMNDWVVMGAAEDLSPMCQGSCRMTLVA